jgi:hypothetical protein
MLLARTLTYLIYRLLPSFEITVYWKDYCWNPKLQRHIYVCSYMLYSRLALGAPVPCGRQVLRLALERQKNDLQSFHFSCRKKEQHQTSRLPTRQLDLSQNSQTGLITTGTPDLALTRFNRLFYICLSQPRLTRVVVPLRQQLHYLIENVRTIQLAWNCLSQWETNTRERGRPRASTDPLTNRNLRHLPVVSEPSAIKYSSTVQANFISCC